MRKGLTLEEELAIVDDYVVKGDKLAVVSDRHHLGLLRIKEILRSHGVEIKPRGGQIQEGNTAEIMGAKSIVYKAGDNKKLFAVCKQTGTKFTDVNNQSGCLTEHILSTFGDVGVPSNTYQRKKYELKHGKRWYEVYFDIIECDEPTRKCSVCGWETRDYENKTGCFEVHLNTEHDMTIEDYLEQYPDEIKFHNTYTLKLNRKDMLEDPDNYVVCKLCGERMRIINTKHLTNVHNITVKEYKDMFPGERLTCNTSSKILSDHISKVNETIVPTWVSKGETEIKDFMDSLGIDNIKYSDRKMLRGKELDIVLPDKNICIEYDGLYWHSDKHGKGVSYHLNKTISCHELGYSLIHIFEDEWIDKNDIVKKKLRHILNKSKSIKIGARKCIIKEILPNDKNTFLNKHHIQGMDTSNISIGAYYGDKLVGVMTFSNRNVMNNGVQSDSYTMNRFCVDGDYTVHGLGSKFIKYFIGEYKPSSIVSYYDRRWVVNALDNVYTKMGFKLIDTVKPSHHYLTGTGNNGRYSVRYHKFNFTKSKIKDKFPHVYSEDKTDWEMMQELGYDRIWDCGSFKYELKLR